MSSWIHKLKPGSSPGLASSPLKKNDPSAPPPTPLEKLLRNAGPVRDDGSDKFFGMENFGNTCYCNSILQALYYSVPFREQVISYPARSSPDSILKSLDGSSRAKLAAALPNGQSGLSPTKARPLVGVPPARNVGPPASLQKPEDRESPEYKKRQAILKGPLVPMDYDNASSYGMTESLFTSLKDIFEGIVASRARMGVVSPMKLMEVLRKENDMFRSAMHQDAHEFLNILLNAVVETVEADAKQSGADGQTDGFSNYNGFAKPPSDRAPEEADVKPVKSSRWVHELFEGTLTSETKCLTCENASQRDEPFLDLSVDLNEHSSVTSCLRKFSQEEMLCERNKFHCDNCGGLQEAEKRMKIKRLPKILALHLKRFKYTEDMERLQKLFHRVVYPYHLRPFNTTDDAEDPDRLYELYAVVVHIGGGPYHGHYVSIIKTEDRGWLLFDDEMVEPVDKDYVRNFFGGGSRLACAYVLFYQETTLEAVRREQQLEDLAAAQPAGAEASTKESIGLGVNVKSNGFLSNGVHQMPTIISPPVTPSADESLVDPLDRAVTATSAAPSPADPSSLRTTAPPAPAPFGLDTRFVHGDVLVPSSSSHEQGIAFEPSSPGPLSPTSGGALGRFRRTSKSLKHKPNFWNSIDLTREGRGREKEKSRSREALREDLANHAAAQTTEPTESTATVERDREGKKNRFSLRRKASEMIKRDKD